MVYATASQTYLRELHTSRCDRPSTTTRHDNQGSAWLNTTQERYPLVGNFPYQRGRFQG